MAMDETKKDHHNSSDP